MVPQYAQDSIEGGPDLPEEPQQSLKRLRLFCRPIRRAAGGRTRALLGRIGRSEPGMRRAHGPAHRARRRRDDACARAPALRAVAAPAVQSARQPASRRGLGCLRPWRRRRKWSRGTPARGENGQLGSRRRGAGELARRGGAGAGAP